MDGIVLYDKPAGITSHDVVARVRRAQGRGVKVGHAGTLDPFATGLLLVLVGRATRVQRWLMDLPKTYEVLARLGATSTTGDPEGEITHTGVFPADPPVLPTGRIMQRPPAYSAVHVDGERAYARARRGEDVVIPEREVTVHRFTQDERDGDRARYTIACSSGTYVRSLIAALHDAYCLELRRTAIGPWDVADADPERVVPLGDALARILPVLPLEGDEARRAAHGRPIERDLAGETLLLDETGPIAIAAPLAAGVARAVVGFRG